MDYTVLSQQDPRWGSKFLGFSRLTIHTHGCTLTGLTMLLNRKFGLNLTPDQVNDKLKLLGQYDRYKNPHGAFLGALIVWANVSRAFPQLKWVYRDYNYNNVKVAWYVYARQMPVLVEVNGAKIGAPKHWVLFIGGGKMVDPWTGSVRQTSFYPLTGSAIFDRA